MCNLSHQGVDPAATGGELVDVLKAVSPGGLEAWALRNPEAALLLPISVWNLLLSRCSCLTLPDPHHGPQGLLPCGPREASGKPPMSLSYCSGVIRALLPRPPSWTGQSCLRKCAAWPSLTQPTSLNYNKIRPHSTLLSWCFWSSQAVQLWISALISLSLCRIIGKRS